MKTKLNFFILFAILLVDYFCYGLIVPIVTEKLNIDTGQNAILASGVVVMLSPVYLIALPILCALSNLWGRKRILIICLALSVISYIVFLGGALIGGAFLVLLSMNLSDVTTAELPVAQSIVADTQNTWLRSYFFGLLAIADLVDIMSTQLHDYLHQVTNATWFDPAFIAVIVVPISLINLLVAMRFLPSTEPVIKEKGKDILTEIIESFAYLLGSRFIRRLLIFFAIFSLAWSLYFQNIYFYLIDGAVIRPERASIFMMYSLGLMLLTLTILYPLLIRLFSFKKLLTACLLLCCIGLLLITFTTTKTTRWSTGILIAMSMPMVIPILWTTLSNHATRKHQAMLFGIAYLVLTLFWELSGPIVKILNMFHPSLPLQIAAVLILCNLFLLLKLDFLKPTSSMHAQLKSPPP